MPKTPVKKLLFFDRETVQFVFCLAQFIENQLPEQVTLQTFMDDLLKMPSEYVDQVMYSLQLQQEQEREDSQNNLKKKSNDRSMDYPNQQRARSNITTTTRSTTSNSHHS